MGPKKEKERIEAEIRKISKLTENKFCIDCNYYGVINLKKINEKSFCIINLEI